MLNIIAQQFYGGCIAGHEIAIAVINKDRLADLIKERRARQRQQIKEAVMKNGGS